MKGHTSHDDGLLAVYLNDHLAGAMVGTELAHRLAGAEAEWVGAGQLRQVAAEVAEDRQALQQMMAALDVPVRHYKVWAGWTLEKVGRLKLNGRLLSRSPLSRLIELEAMRLGVEGKAAAWRTLRTRAEIDSRLDTKRIDELIERARRQIDQLERLRVRAAQEVFGGAGESTSQFDVVNDEP